jgi:hypothetical protein
MAKKSELIIAKARRIVGDMWRHLGFIKYIIVTFVLLILASVIAVTIWARIKPIAEYRSSVEKLIESRLLVDDVQIKSVQWAFELSSLSIGIEATELSYKDLNRAIEGAVPSLKVLWTPWKLMLGSVAISVRADESTWQLGEKTSLQMPNAPRISILKNISQPTFLESRMDVYLRGEGLTVAVAAKNDSVVLLEAVKVRGAILGLKSHFDGQVSAHVRKSSDLGLLSGRLIVDWKGAFQYVDRSLVGISVDTAKIDFSDSNIDGWGLFKSPKEALHATFGIQLLVNDDGEFSTVDVKGGKFKFADLNFVFDGDQKNASGAAFKWVLENQQLNNNKLPFQILHQAKASGPIQAEGRVSLTNTWDFSSLWSLRANGINFKAVELGDQFDPRSEGKIVFNLAFDGGLEDEILSFTTFQLKLDAKEALLISKNKAFTKPVGQEAQIQFLADVQDDRLSIKPSFFEWADFKVDVKGQVEGLSQYLFHEKEADFQLEANTGKVDISRIAPLLNFLKQNPVPSGNLEFAAAVSGSLGKKSLAKQLEDKELAWRIDRLSLSAFKAGLDTGVWSSKLKDSGYYLDGVIHSDLSLRARGRGYLIQTSNVQADIDLTDAEFVWADEFRKLRGVAGKLKLGLVSVPNKIEFKSSRAVFLDTGINFSGVLNQGSRSRIALSFERPIDLAKWRGFFRAREDFPLQGTVESKLFLSLLTTPDQMDGGIDWRRVGLTGSLKFQNVSGLRGPLSSLDQASGDLSFSSGKVELTNLKTKIGSHEFLSNGFIQPVGQRGAISFYDLASAKQWNADLDIKAKNLDVFGVLKKIYPSLQRNKEQGANSLEPAQWLGAQEMSLLSTWPLLEKVNFKTRWRLDDLRAGPWMLSKVDAELSHLNDKLRFGVKKSNWKNGSNFSGSGVLDFKPKGGASSLPLSGTWNLGRAPLRDLLALWDLRETKVIEGLFSGSLVYAIEKSVSPQNQDVVRLNFDGQVSNADHAVMKIIKPQLETKLRELQVSQNCFAAKWGGKFSAWSAGGDALQIDQASWTSGTTKVDWSVKADQEEQASITGKWLPSATCLGVKAAKCWSAVALAESNLGHFVVRGPWDKLSLTWPKGGVDKVRDCINQAGGASPASASSKDVVSDTDIKKAADLKNYLKKNAN